jgi:hypothetical protein
MEFTVITLLTAIQVVLISVLSGLSIFLFRGTRNAIKFHDVRVSIGIGALFTITFAVFVLATSRILSSQYGWIIVLSGLIVGFVFFLSMVSIVHDYLVSHKIIAE